MTHNEIYGIFEKLFPMYAEGVVDYFSNGKDSIRIRIGDLYQDFVFTFHSNKDWKFETIDSFINSMKKENTK